jgi:hypothetical protein
LTTNSLPICLSIHWRSMIGRRWHQAGDGQEGAFCHGKGGRQKSACSRSAPKIEADVAVSCCITRIICHEHLYYLLLPGSISAFQDIYIGHILQLVLHGAIALIPTTTSFQEFRPNSHRRRARSSTRYGDRVAWLPELIAVPSACEMTDLPTAKRLAGGKY